MTTPQDSRHQDPRTDPTRDQTSREATIQPMPREPHEGIKADADVETRQTDAEQTSYVSRAGTSSGIPGTGPEPRDEQPSEAVAGGTAGGDVLGGVTATAQDSEEAVSGDTGPEHPGQHA